MKVKKDLFKKIFWPLLVILAILALIIGLAVDWSFPKFIYASGSSSIQPLMQQIANIYKPAEILSEAGGSSVGIRAVLDDVKNIGMASKSPLPNQAGLPATNNQPLVDGSNSETWNKDEIKTITIAWDGIGILYRSSSKNPLVLNQDNIKLLYEAFAGYNNITLNQLQSNLPNLIIKPFARTGGATLSGTAESFYEDSRLLKNVDELSPQIQDALNNGVYGNNTIQTQEANLQAFSQAENFDVAGYSSMVYLSTGFIKNNLKQIENMGFKIAEYQDPKTNKIFSVFNNNDLNVTHGYNWFRPFNFLVRLENIKTYVKTFIDWYFHELFTKGSELNHLLDIDGYVPLTKTQYESMTIDHNFWVSDYSLLKIHSQYVERQAANIWYGAIN